MTNKTKTKKVVKAETEEAKETYKEVITRMSNNILIREHFGLHLDPTGNTNKHAIVAGELKRRGIRHLTRKGDILDKRYEKTLTNLKKEKK